MKKKGRMTARDKSGPEDRVEEWNCCTAGVCSEIKIVENDLVAGTRISSFSLHSDATIF